MFFGFSPELIYRFSRIVFYYIFGDFITITALRKIVIITDKKKGPKKGPEFNALDNGQTKVLMLMEIRLLQAMPVLPLTAM